MMLKQDIFKIGILALIISSVICNVYAESPEKEFAHKGLKLYKESKFEEAIAEFSRAIEINPKYANAYMRRGICYHDTKKYDLAVADYDKAIIINPKDEWAHYERA